MMPIMTALDADEDGEISAEEIENAVAALKELDKEIAAVKELVQSELFLDLIPPEVRLTAGT